MLASLFKGATTTTVPADTAAQFYAGFLWGITLEDKQNEIVSCFKNDSDLNDMLADMIEAGREGKSEDAKKLFDDSRSHWDASLKVCTKDSIYDEYVALDQFTETVMSRSDIDL